MVTNVPSREEIDILVCPGLHNIKILNMYGSLNIFYRIAVRSALAKGDLASAGIIERCEICTAAHPVWKTEMLTI